MRLFSVLDAKVPGFNPGRGQTRLWVIASSTRQAVNLLKQRKVWYREASGPVAVDLGPVTETFARLGLLSAPAILAYPVPHDRQTSVMKLDVAGRLSPVASMGEILNHL
jgi:hypothetical protein